MPDTLRAAKAEIGDAQAIHDVINLYAQRGDMLPRTMGEVYENLRDFFVVRQGDEFMGCVGLHIVWSDLAELKSLAVPETVQARGIGSALVNAAVDEARRIGLERVFALTYRPTFFERLGFVQADVMTLPRKVWNECYRCPKFPSCNEIALTFDLNSGGERAAVTDDKTYPVVISSQEIYRGRVIKLHVDEIEFAPGIEVKREVIDHPGAVVIIPVDAEGMVLWVKQHRYAAGRVLLELPAGTLEAGEEPEQCARRELAEETGFAASAWQKLGGFYSAPGFCSEYLHAFAATQLRPEAAEGDEDEDIEVVPLSLEESLARIDAGEVEDAKSIATMHLYLRKRF